MQRRIRFCEKYYNDISNFFFQKSSKLNEIDRIDTRMVVNLFVTNIFEAKLKLVVQFQNDCLMSQIRLLQ